MLTIFPEELDCNAYKERYKDLVTKSDAELKRHWDIYGIKEDRCGSTITKVQELLPFIGKFSRVLEIGPFDNPFIEPLRGTCDIYYADRLNQEELLQRASKYPESVGA